MGLFSTKKDQAYLAESELRVLELESECRGLMARLEGAEQLVLHLDEDRDLLLGALERLHPGAEPVDLAGTLLDLCFRPFSLACFYVALADWEQDQLRFILYHEGGRVRNHPSRRLSDRAGLSESVLLGGRPIYIRTLEEGQAAGSLLTAAEQATGLIPHSWYGIPLGRGQLPMGLVSFQSFQADAFTDSRRRIMEALAGLLATCLATPSGQ